VDAKKLKLWFGQGPSVGAVGASSVGAVGAISVGDVGAISVDAVDASSVDVFGESLATHKQEDKDHSPGHGSAQSGAGDCLAASSLPCLHHRAPCGLGPQPHLG
jgi:hypothetical protein